MVFRGKFFLEGSILSILFTISINQVQLLFSRQVTMHSTGPRDCSVPSFPVPQHLRDKFYGQNWGVKAAGCVTFFWLVGGNIKGGAQKVCAQSGFHFPPR